MTSEWMQVRGALGVLNQLAGNTANTLTWDGENYSGNDRLQLTGLNAAVAPSTTTGVTRIFRPNGDSTDQAVAADTTATAKLSDILAMETYAQAQLPYIRPLSETSGIKYHYYVHTQSYNDLINDTTAPLNASGLALRSALNNLVNSWELLIAKVRTIISEALYGNVQRLEGDLVHSSEWKCQTSFGMVI